MNTEQAHIRPTTPATHNVILGWLGYDVPDPPKQRNHTRAGYRKTTRTRRRGQAHRARQDKQLQLL